MQRTVALRCYRGGERETGLIHAIAGHLRHHLRFYAAGLLGIAVGLATHGFDPLIRLILASDGFFGLYLMLMSIMATRATTDSMRTRAAFEDEGVILIVLITVAAIGVCIAAIFMLLGQGSPDARRLLLSMATVLLGWLTLHTMMAFHYAQLYYAPERAADGKRSDAGGLAFPKTPRPGPWDFLYYSFVVGMTAQVSDVQVQNTTMRRLTLAHGVLAFLFNTVLLALAVNVAASQVR